MVFLCEISVKNVVWWLRIIIEVMLVSRRFEAPSTVHIYIYKTPPFYTISYEFGSIPKKGHTFPEQLRVLLEMNINYIIDHSGTSESDEGI